MSLLEKFVIMVELDAGSFATDINTIEKKTKNVVEAAKAAAQVDFSQMAKLPTSFDTIINILERMQTNLGKAVGQSEAFNNSLGDIKNQMSQVVQNTSDIGTKIINTKNTTNTLNISLKNTNNTVLAIGENVEVFGKKIKKATNETDLLKKILSATRNALKGIGSSALGKLKEDLSNVVSVSNMVSSSLKRIDEMANLGKVAEQSRIAVDDLDALGRSARNLGGDVETANNDIKNLADNALEAFNEGGSDAAKAFNDLGLSLKDNNGDLKDTNTLLLEMADATQGLSDTQAKSKLESLGISDPGMISLIKSGKDGILEQVEAQKKLGVTTSEQVKEANEFQNAQNALTDVLKAASGELITLLLPAITAVVEGLKKFTSFCRENKTFATIFFGAIALAVGVYAVAAAGAAIATNAFLWPVLLVIAAVAAFAYVLNDVMNYLNGKPSHLGDAINWISEQVKAFGKVWEVVWGKIKELAAPIITFLKDSFNTFWDIIKEIAAALKALFSGDFSGFATHMESVFNKIRDFWDNMWNGFTNIVGTIVSEIKTKLWNMLPNWAKRWLDSSDKDKADAQRKIEEEDKKTALIEAQKHDEFENNRVSHDIVPSTKVVDQTLTQTGKNAIKETSTIPIPANANQKIDVKKDTRVEVNAPITINNTVDTKEAVEAAARAALDIIQREMNKAISNSDNAIAR